MKSFKILSLVFAFIGLSILVRLPEATANELHTVAGLPSNFVRTHRMWDLAITSHKFFVVKSGDGQSLFTRAGSFVITADGYITTRDGYILEAYAVNKDGELSKDLSCINIVDLSFTNPTDEEKGQAPAQLTYIDINRVGQVIGIYSNGRSQKIYQIPLAEFQNPDDLTWVSGYVLSANRFSGTPQVATINTSDDGWILSFTLDTDFSYPELPDFSQHVLKSTNRQTDLAIAGKGFFVVQDGLTGEYYYTRDGHFVINSNGQLVSSTGDLKPLAFKFSGNQLGSQLVPIELNSPEINTEFVSITILSDGIVQGIESDQTSVNLYQIPLAKFINEEGLEDVIFTKNVYKHSFSSGSPLIGIASDMWSNIFQYALEELD